jgi:hypothetical protein
VAAAALVLLLGWAAWRQVPDSVEVLNGRKRAVSEAEYQRWLALESAIRQRSSVEFRDRVSGRAHEAALREKANWDRQFDKEREVLRVISDVLERREAATRRQEAELAEREQVFAARAKRAQDAARDANFQKVLQLYQGLAPELVAADFQKKWMSGGEERQEVVRLLRGLPSRVSAEVIGAISDSMTRAEIMREVTRS